MTSQPEQQTAAQRVVIIKSSAMGKTEQLVGMMELMLNRAPNSAGFTTVPTPFMATGALSDMRVTSFGREVLRWPPAQPRASKGWRKHVRQQKARDHG
jgi:hypothetical protein